MRLGLLLVWVFFGLGCDRVFEGDLRVDRELTLKTGIWRYETIAAGDYRADLSFEAVTHRLVVVLDDNPWKKYKLRIPRDFEMPREGDFFIDSSRLDQRYDVAGHLDLDIQTDGPYRKWASCQYQCGYYTRHTGSGNHYDGDGCPTEPRYCQGSYEYEYNLVTETRDISSDLLEADESVAHFTGRHVYRYEDVLWRSACR